jgi:sulfur carrier protein
MASCRFPVQWGGGFFFCFLPTGRAMEIEVRINGTVEQLKECTIKTLVAGKGLDAASLVVEYNGRIVKQADWSKVLLEQGDVLELLNFVGGG